MLYFAVVLRASRPGQLIVQLRRCASNTAGGGEAHKASAAAARLVGDTRKVDRGLRQLKHVDPHWLDVPAERVKFKLMSMVHNCLRHKAPGT